MDISHEHGLIGEIPSTKASHVSFALRPWATSIPIDTLTLLCPCQLAK